MHTVLVVAKSITVRGGYNRIDVGFAIVWFCFKMHDNQTNTRIV